MIPNPGEVVRRQWTVRGLTRLVGAGLMVLAVGGGLLGFAVSVGLWITEGMRDDVLFGLFFSFIGTVVLFGLGVAVAAMSGVVSRWAAPYPKTTPCPRCGYGLEALAVPKCSECGLDLTPEFMPEAAIKPAFFPTREEQVVRHRALFRPIVRLLAVVVLAPLALMAVPLVVSLIDSMRWGDPLWEEPGWVLTALWWFGASVLTLVVLLVPGLFARWLVPGIRGPDPSPEGVPDPGLGGGPGVPVGRAETPGGASPISPGAPVAGAAGAGADSPEDTLEGAPDGESDDDPDNAEAGNPGQTRAGTTGDSA